jgi:deoxyribodipyrimidine photo-lyase
VNTVVVLFTRDLRVHDNPALAAACRVARHVVPLFVHDPAVPSSPGRDRFLAESLADLRSSLRERGGDLVVRTGDPVVETLSVASTVDAGGIALAADVSAYARRREARLTEGAGRRSVRLFPGVTVVPPGELAPAGSNHYKVFTPYWRAWQAASKRPVEKAPARMALPPGLTDGRPPAADPAAGTAAGTGFAPGGETAGRARVRAWRGAVAGYGDRHDDLPGDATSRLSPYLHFGCVSIVDLVGAMSRVDGAEPFVRQVCWRDFYAQVLHAFPYLRTRPFRSGAADDWRVDRTALQAWQAGQTGMPIVDAGMRQLLAEGWMHNRARLITASYLTKHLRLDWRSGAAWFDAHLLDADVANNHGNWQWVAGTGTDTKPYRRFNPVRQALRFDPDGEYVRRYVPELAGVPGKAVHTPWELDAAQRRALTYPEPL